VVEKRSAGRPLRVGVIGVGWGAAVHVPAFRVAGDYEVVALCSSQPARAAAAGARLGIDDVSTDWQAFVRRDDLEVISVATPTDLHYGPVLAALQAGKHVLCEKPLALDVGQASEMVKAAEAAGTATAACFENRYGREKLPVRDLVAAGYLGTPFFCRVDASADYWHPSRRPQAEWMYRLDRGGGYLLGLAAHDIDFLCCLFGEPEAVCADVRTTVPVRQLPDGRRLDVDADDTASLLLRLRSGLRAVVSVSVIGLHTRSDYRFEAFGSDATITIDGSLYEGRVRAGALDDDGLAEVAPSAREPRGGLQATRRSDTAVRAMALLLEDWVPALRGGTSPGVPTLRDGLTVQRVIDAARRSSDGAGWVRLTDAAIDQA
jgi:predicted dehydrogenase